MQLYTVFVFSPLCGVTDGCVHGCACSRMDVMFYMPSLPRARRVRAAAAADCAYTSHKSRAHRHGDHSFPHRNPCSWTHPDCETNPGPDCFEARSYRNLWTRPDCETKLVDTPGLRNKAQRTRRPRPSRAGRLARSQNTWPRGLSARGREAKSTVRACKRRDRAMKSGLFITK